MTKTTREEIATALLAWLVAFLAVVALADAPRFVTPSMTDRRNGLTDAQYEALWAVGKNPAISQAAARDWMVRASRYANFTNWLDTAGRSNDFARLASSFQHRAITAESATNALTTLNATLSERCAVFSNAVTIARAQATDAEARAQASSNALHAVTAFLTEKRDAAKLNTTKALYQAVIDKISETSR